MSVTYKSLRVVNRGSSSSLLVDPVVSDNIFTSVKSLPSHVHSHGGRSSSFLYPSSGRSEIYSSRASGVAMFSADGSQNCTIAATDPGFGERGFVTKFPRS